MSVESQSPHMSQGSQDDDRMRGGRKKKKTRRKRGMNRVGPTALVPGRNVLMIMCCMKDIKIPLCKNQDKPF